MANAELNVILSADGKQLATTMQKAEKDVQGLENELKDLQPAFETVNKSLNKAAAGLKTTAQSFQPLIKGIKLSEEALAKLPKSSNASAQSLLNLGRVAQDAPFGILGIANNINPLLESFQRLQAESGSTKTALKSLVGGLTGAGGLGLAVSVISSLMIVFADKLFGAGEASKASENALRSFGDALDRVKDGVKSLSDELQFANALGGINVKVRGGDEIQDLREQSIAQRQQTQALEGERDKLKKIGQQITDNIEFNVKDRIDAELKYFDSLKSINSDIVKSQQDQSLIYARIRLGRKEKTDKDNEDALKLNDKFIEQTIARAKRLAAFLTKTTIRFVPFEIDPEATKGEQFNEAINFIQKALTQREAFSLKPQILVENPVLLKSQAYFASLQKESAKLLQDLQEEISKLTRRNPVLIEAERVQVEQKARGTEFFQALGIGSADENAPVSLLTNLQKEAVNAAQTINGVLRPAFDSLFNAIKAGENPIKAFFQGLGQALTQLIQQLIQAALQALILQAITGGGASFGSIFKSLIGFKAEGGPVFAGKPYVVGEKGPELFIPQGGGRIVPNNEMNSGLAGVTGGMQTIRVVGEIRNRNILLGNAREQRSQRRNF